MSTSDTEPPKSGTETTETEAEKARYVDGVIGMNYVDTGSGPSYAMDRYQKKPGVKDVVGETVRQTEANYDVVRDLKAFNEGHPVGDLEPKEKVELLQIADRAARVDAGHLNAGYFGEIKYAWKSAPDEFDGQVKKVEDVLFVLENGKAPESPFPHDQQHIRFLRELVSAQVPEEVKTARRIELEQTVVKLKREKQKVMELAAEKNPHDQRGQQAEEDFKRAYENLEHSRKMLRELSGSLVDEYKAKG